MRPILIDDKILKHTLSLKLAIVNLFAEFRNLGFKLLSFQFGFELDRMYEWLMCWISCVA